MERQRNGELVGYLIDEQFFTEDRGEGGGRGLRFTTRREGVRMYDSDRGGGGVVDDVRQGGGDDV